MDDRPCNRDLLLHAGRHLGNQLAPHRVHLQGAEDRLNSARELIVVHPVQLAKILDVFACGHAIVKCGVGGHEADAVANLGRFLADIKPATMADPLVGSRTVLSIRIVVDLPAPLGPSKPKISPVKHSKET